MTIDFEVRTELRDLLRTGRAIGTLFAGCARACDSFAQLLLIGGKRFTKRFAISIVTFATLDDVDTILEIVLVVTSACKSETIEQLRPEFSFFRITRTDQNKTRRMLDRNSFALDFISARHRHVEQQIDEVIFEQVYFVDI